jgi:hypothetical protein
VDLAGPEKSYARGKGKSLKLEEKTAASRGMSLEPGDISKWQALSYYHDNVSDRASLSEQHPKG